MHRSCTKALQLQNQCQRIQTRGLAAAASGSFQYETGEELGIKYASRDLPGPTTTLTLVAKAGTRYQTQPGYSDALEKFAFKVCQAEARSCVGEWKLNFCPVNHETIGGTDCQRGGAFRWRDFSLSFPRESGPACQISPRRPSIFHRASGRSDIKNQICAWVNSSLTLGYRD
jgi:hypothetical protein